MRIWPGFQNTSLDLAEETVALGRTPGLLRITGRLRLVGFLSNYKWFRISFQFLLKFTTVSNGLGNWWNIRQTVLKI